MPSSDPTAIGNVCVTHEFPPSVVAMMSPSPDESLPTAQQSDVEAQVIPMRLGPLGRASVVHVLPPSVVAMTTPSLEELKPSAQQSEVEALAMPPPRETLFGIV
jgi:hypothetical protein